MTAGTLARIRHGFVAWRRNLAANRLLSAIAIAGLAIGLTGAILMALVARIALGYNHIVPDRDRIYLAVSVLSGAGMAPNYNAASNGGVAALARLNVPEIEAAARLAEAEAELRRGGGRRRETIYWADPGLFGLLRLPVLQGDLAAALRRADGLVMTRAGALRHFGRADAVGGTIDVDGRPMTLRAVIADLPPNATDLDHGIFASGLAAGGGRRRPGRSASARRWGRPPARSCGSSSGSSAGPSSGPI